MIFLLPSWLILFLTFTWNQSCNERQTVRAYTCHKVAGLGRQRKSYLEWPYTIVVFFLLQYLAGCHYMFAITRNVIEAIWMKYFQFIAVLLNIIIEVKLEIFRGVDILLIFTDLVWFRDFFGENNVRKWNVVVGHEWPRSCKNFGMCRCTVSLGIVINKITRNETVSHVGPIVGE
jgi:hypothetical protein